MSEPVREPPRLSHGTAVDLACTCLDCEWTFRYIGHYQDDAYRNARKRPYDHARTKTHRVVCDLTKTFEYGPRAPWRTE